MTLKVKIICSYQFTLSKKFAITRIEITPANVVFATIDRG